VALRGFEHLQELQVNEFTGIATVSQIGEDLLDTWFNTRPSLRVVQIISASNGRPAINCQWIRIGKSLQKARGVPADATLWENSVAKALA
jgi:hypothetical protein